VTEQTWLTNFSFLVPKYCKEMDAIVLRTVLFNENSQKPYITGAENSIWFQYSHYYFIFENTIYIFSLYMDAQKRSYPYSQNFATSCDQWGIVLTNGE
jgi:hypothetical protein